MTYQELLNLWKDLNSRTLYNINWETGETRELKGYQKKKAIAQDVAGEWQYSFTEETYSYGELLEFEDFFRRVGKQYGLLREFREDGIV